MSNEQYKKNYSVDGWPIEDTKHKVLLGTDEIAALLNNLQGVIQMCFDDACKPSGKISKKTAIELMKYADRAA